MKLAARPIDSGYVTAALVVAFSAVGAFRARREALGSLAIGMGLLAALLVVENALVTEGVAPPVAGDFVFLGAIMAVVWALGAGLRERAGRADELEARAVGSRTSARTGRARRSRRSVRGSRGSCTTSSPTRSA